MSKLREAVALVAICAAIAGMSYVGLAWEVFQWRNPTANKYAFWRNPVAVLRFEKLARYQAN